MLNHLPLEEKWNVYTHAFGALASLSGFVYALFSLNDLALNEIIGLVVYGASIVFLFSASAKYHSVTGEQQAYWQKVDHIGIFFSHCRNLYPGYINCFNGQFWSLYVGCNLGNCAFWIGI